MLRKHHEAAGSTDAYSPAEEMFNRRRRTFGFFAAPGVLLLLDDETWRDIAGFVMIVVLVPVMESMF